MSKAQSNEQESNTVPPVDAQTTERAYGIEVKEFRPPDISAIANQDPNYAYYGESKALLEKYGIEQVCGNGYEFVRRSAGREQFLDPEGRRLAGTDAPRGKLCPDDCVEQGDNVLVRCHKDYAKSREKFYLEKDREHVRSVKVVKGKEASDIAEQRMKDSGLSRRDIDKGLARYKGGASTEYIVMAQ
jgi:hypothetical protein